EGCRVSEQVERDSQRFGCVRVPLSRKGCAPRDRDVIEALALMLDRDVAVRRTRPRVQLPELLLGPWDQREGVALPRWDRGKGHGIRRQRTARADIGAIRLQQAPNVLERTTAERAMDR